MNEVNWSDIMANDLNSIDIKVNNNADPSKCNSIKSFKYINVKTNYKNL